MAKDTQTLFHETWLGEVQPLEGLTFSVPVLCDGGVMQRLSAAEAREFGDFLELAAADPAGEGDDEAEGPARLVDLREALVGFFGWNEDELQVEDELPDELVLRIAEEGTELRPSFAIPRGADPEGGEGDADEGAEASKLLDAGEQTPATRAGAAYQLLAWELPPGLDLDASESETSQWHYPPTAKLERMLRATRVPMGLLCNGEVLRLLYCPHGHATGWVTFSVAYMATPAGRDMLSALRELLHADRVMGGMPDTPTTLELLERSRERQADVTTGLGGQVLEALQILLEGFEAAAHRDGDAVLREAMRVEGNHVYEGLLTVMLRLIFALYAEDRGLLPIEHPVYAEHLSVSGLHDALVVDAGAYGDTMDQRFGAWPRLIMLFRALYFGLEHRAPEGPDLSMPPHRGRLFNPENYAFLEGCMPAGGAPVSPEDRARTRLPSLSDGVVYRVLRRLLFLEGQRLSYSALEEEQLGSVYEGLMGYEIERRMSASICLAPSRVWVSPRDLLERPQATRVRWLQDSGVTAAAAKRLVAGLRELETRCGDDGEALEAAALALLREFSVAPPRKRSRARPGKELLSAEVAADRLVIQPGEERRRTSSHYTPRSLSGPIVARTLEPLLAAMRAKVGREQPGLEDPQPSAEDLLSLKICDPAMGSGAFLVESCRYLASQVVAAWVREGSLEEQIAAAGDEAAKRKPEQLAMRMVAQRCLYGVDKNPLAVELGKLSLWLLTLARGQTFTFLDHCLKAGDSLVGLSKEQVLALDWSIRDVSGGAAKKEGKKKGRKSKKAKAGEQGQLDLFAGQAKRAFDKATRARQALAQLATSSDRDDIERRQHGLHVEAERALERLRDVADVVLSSYFWPVDDQKEGEKLRAEFLFEGKKVSDKARTGCLARVRDELNIWLARADGGRMPWNLELRRELVRGCIRPMHWELEFPEVFSDERVDPLAEDGVGKVWMDAVVGNPPFMRGKSVSSNFGSSYTSWLGLHFLSSKNGDIAALFFRRASELLGSHGTIGLIATNSISQGDTRDAGLKPLVDHGLSIYHATQDMAWPVKGANVSVSLVHMAKGHPLSTCGPKILNGTAVPHLSSALRSKPERPNPVKIASNAGKSYQGSVVLGKGFILSPADKMLLCKNNELNEERIRPYIGGEELNSSPTQEHERYVINFDTVSLSEAEKWPELIDIVRIKVKPDRDKNKREGYRKNWWRFAEPQKSLRAALSHMDRCVATSYVSKHRVFAFQPTDRILANTLAVIALSGNADFGLLQSRIHTVWARLQGSSMRNDLRYTPSSCFETFPFPDPPTLAEDAPLEAIAKRLYETRAAFMVRTDQGLTKTYNALKDPEDTTPEVEELRRLHEELDRAVLDAYGQSEIVVPAYVGASAEELERFEDQILDFLFERNALLAAQEAKAAKRAKG